MLAFARLIGAPYDPQAEGVAYIDPEHPVQQLIRSTLAEMCDIALENIEMGVDGCSVPNFALPLRQVALGYARLCDPQAGEVHPPARAAACQVITQAMIAHPEMVGGPDRFDTRLMEVGSGRFVVKGGAEGYQGVGIMPGALGPGSPALGIAAKIADGDLRSRARPAVILEILRQLGALQSADLLALKQFGPQQVITNWRKVQVGEGRPCFTLHTSPSSYTQKPEVIRDVA